MTIKHFHVGNFYRYACESTGEFCRIQGHYEAVCVLFNCTCGCWDDQPVMDWKVKP